MDTALLLTWLMIRIKTTLKELQMDIFGHLACHAEVWQICFQVWSEDGYLYLLPMGKQHD